MGRGAEPGRVSRSGVLAGGIVLLGALLAAAAVFFLVAPREPAASPSSSPSPPLLGGVPEEGRDPEPAPAVGDGAAVPFVTGTDFDAATGEVTIRAFVPGLAEEMGVCRAILSGDAGSTTIEVAARIEVATTTCEVMTVSTAQTGTTGLSVVVEYESSTSSGRSEPKGVEVG